MALIYHKNVSKSVLIVKLVSFVWIFHEVFKIVVGGDTIKSSENEPS